MIKEAKKSNKNIVIIGTNQDKIKINPNKNFHIVNNKVLLYNNNIMINLKYIYIIKIV